MALQQLRSFIEVYRRGSLSDAARALGLTQPAVSQQMQSLEEQLGRPLFERHARGVRPTRIADDLAAALGTSLDHAESVLAVVRARSRAVRGTVHLAGPAEYLSLRFADRIARLTGAGMEARLQTGGRALIYAKLLADEVDLAVTASAPQDARLGAEEIDRERLLLVAAPALAARLGKGASLALDAARCLAYDAELPLIRVWCAANGIDRPHAVPAATAPDLRLLARLAREGIGWTVLPDYLVAPDLAAGALHLIDAPRETPINPLYLVWAKGSLRHPRVALARSLLLSRP